MTYKIKYGRNMNRLDYDEESETFLIHSGLCLRRTDGSLQSIVIPFSKEEIQQNKIDLSDDYIDSFVECFYQRCLSEGNTYKDLLVDNRGSVSF